MLCIARFKAVGQQLVNNTGWACAKVVAFSSASCEVLARLVGWRRCGFSAQALASTACACAKVSRTAWAFQSWLNANQHRSLPCLFEKLAAAFAVYLYNVLTRVMGLRLAASTAWASATMEWSQSENYPPTYPKKVVESS